MLALNEQLVQHCCCEALQLQVPTDQQAVQHCGCETLSLESCQPPLEFFWRHLKGRLPVWRELRFLHA